MICQVTNRSQPLNKGLSIKSGINFILPLLTLTTDNTCVQNPRAVRSVQKEKSESETQRIALVSTPIYLSLS